MTKVSLAASVALIALVVVASASADACQGIESSRCNRIDTAYDHIANHKLTDDFDKVSLLTISTKLVQNQEKHEAAAEKKRIEVGEQKSKVVEHPSSSTKKSTKNAPSDREEQTTDGDGVAKEDQLPVVQKYDQEEMKADAKAVKDEDEDVALFDEGNEEDGQEREEVEGSREDEEEEGREDEEEGREDEEEDEEEEGGEDDVEREKEETEEGRQDDEEDEGEGEDDKEKRHEKEILRLDEDGCRKGFRCCQLELPLTRRCVDFDTERKKGKYGVTTGVEKCKFFKPEICFTPRKGGKARCIVRAGTWHHKSEGGCTEATTHWSRTKNIDMWQVQKAKTNNQKGGPDKHIRVKRPSRRSTGTSLKVNGKYVTDKKWYTMEDAGWTDDDIKGAKQDTETEAKDSWFQQKFLNKITYNGVKCCASYNDKFKEFTHAKDAKTYLSKVHPNGCPADQRQAVFVLGPSAAGKTSSLATVFDELQLKFPAMSYDGADWRDASEVWKKNAKSGHLKKDYFDDIFQKGAKPMLKKLLKEWMEKYKPCTVIRPSTAVMESYINGIENLLDTGIYKLIKEMKKLKYTVQFVAILAPKQAVVTNGARRSLGEGKEYSSKNFENSIEAVKNIYDSLGHSGYHFTFQWNSMVENEPLLKMRHEEYFRGLKDLEGLEKTMNERRISKNR